MSDLTVYPDHESFVRGTAEYIAGIAAQSITERGRFVIALSGGSTPRPVYTRLAHADYTRNIDWSKVQIFFSDERCVPPDEPHSNYRMVRETLLDHLHLPPENIHRIRGDDDPALAAFSYEQEVQRLFHSSPPPPFDLILLGLGENGHTASLFPGTAALRESVRWVLPQYIEGIAAWRVTFTTVLINAARNITFLTEGVGKADTLSRVLNGPYDPEVLPAQLIQPSNGHLRWIVDAAAATKLNSV